jgi:hypothetical protein
MKRLAVAVLVAVAAVFATTYVVGALNRTSVPASVGNPIVERGCVVRYDTLDGAGARVVPRIHEDASHICVGVTAVALEANGDLRIENAGGPWKIVTVWVVLDESLAAQGLTCGVSGGGTVSIVRCYNPAGVRIRHDSLTMYGPGNNIWFGALNWAG